MYIRVIAFIILTVSCLPVAAQNNWEVPQEYQYDNKPAKEAKPRQKHEKANEKLKCDIKYLDGTVPVNDKGIVEWQKNIQLNGVNGSEAYEKAYTILKEYVESHNPFKESRIALVNREKKSIIATVKDWLVFKNTALALDRSKISYAIVADCSDNNVSIAITRLSYEYEENRPTGFKLSAEELITDDKALNKKHTNVSRMYGKFRIKTIDLKDELFKWFENELVK